MSMDGMFRSVLVVLVFLLICPPWSYSAEMNMDQGTMTMDHGAMDAEGQWTAMRPDGNAPGGVMGGNLHHSKKWMLSYQYMYMDMAGNRDGTDRLDVSDVFDMGYLISPTDMTMQMHMFGAMYAPSDNVTLMAMVPYTIKNMDHQTSPSFMPAPDTTFTTESKGLSDIKVSSLVSLMKKGMHRLHLNAGLSFPTGSIDEKDDLPPFDGVESQLPYPMQLGSGTYDLLAGLTYLGQSNEWSWGAQTTGTYRTGENDNGYTLGNVYTLTPWAARKWSSKVSTSLRINGQTWGNIDGSDSKLMVPPAANPTADPNLRGGTRWDLLLGGNVFLKGSGMRGHRLFLEGGVPFYQDLDGPQLETDWMVTFAYRYGF